jgi:hypothetical protein
MIIGTQNTIHERDLLPRRSLWVASRSPTTGFAFCAHRSRRAPPFLIHGLAVAGVRRPSQAPWQEEKVDSSGVLIVVITAFVRAKAKARTDRGQGAWRG